jgi:hypothetical protein
VTDWWVGIPDAETRVSCGGETHTLRWHAGRLHALDHDDVEGERALAALGGERCTCVELLDAWARHTDDLRVLTLASRGPADRLAVEVDWLGSSGRGRRRGLAIAGRASGWTAYGPGGPAMGGWEEAEDDLVPLLALGGGLADRLVASVAAAWARTRESNGDVAASRASLTAALYGRVATVLRGWLGEPNLDVELEMSDGVGASRVARLEDGGIHAVLPFSWLSDVWSRGIATIGGRFVLGVAIEAGGERWTLETLAPDLETAQSWQITVRV